MGQGQEMTLNTNIPSLTQLLAYTTFRSLAAIASENSIMIDPSSRCYITTFVKISPLVPKKIFSGSLPYMGVVAILVM